ncbi:phosphoribosyltransferase family protein [Domibacillus aminovorans]|uniref:Adenine/guanine phosphoribosyltransferase n=1 Tax=Domibacillus aminovorans TaxID=29332 RepID=A0A177L608_9BACI|nr:phosphoribosyltransferase family protein [Domibacillus aminovorans]OAH61148.1 hypothetical protein AWH49_02365 [Domibacillus aminovorans]
MKTTHSSIYYPNQYTHNINGSLEVDIRIEANPYNLPVESLYEMAARINKKRSFLFVSKVLGKHIPLHPCIPFISSALLASIYYEEEMSQTLAEKEQLIEALKDGSKERVEAAYSVAKELSFALNEPVVFIGFAETATALGHGVFDCFTNASYIHSTRERIVDQEVTLYFEEEHSHATDQLCYAPKEMFDHDKPICLVDDEITTGKTALNIISSIQKKYPRKEYTVLSLLDWRTKEDRQRLKDFEDMWGIQIKTYSLLSGAIQVKGTPDVEEQVDADEQIPLEKINDHSIHLRDISSPIAHYPYSSVDSHGTKNDTPYSALTGRFGLSSKHRQSIEDYCRQVGQYLKTKRVGKKTLCLGTGEFMHLPMKASVYMGDGISYHSTTRSPIFPLNNDGYPIKNRLVFESPDDPGIVQYAYNILNSQYDEVFLFFERTVSEERRQSLLRQFYHVPHIHVVDFI